MRRMLMAAVGLTAMTLATSVYAQGTEAEAKALLAKAVAAVKADQAKAVAMFTAGEGGFLDRDLYVFCMNTKDGKIATTQAKQLIGTDARDLKDANGKQYGPDLLAGAQKDTISQVEYMFPRPGADKTPVSKVSFVTRASADLGCGVGYYK